jgi:hypothetical protein
LIDSLLADLFQVAVTEKSQEIGVNDVMWQPVCEPYQKMAGISDCLKSKQARSLHSPPVSNQPTKW